jgi:farnesyl diphosphate synthase
MPQPFKDWLKTQQQRMEVVLDAVLPTHIIPHLLQEVMRYAVLGGGKRIRPLLTFAVGEVVDAPSQCIEQVAAAIELIHVYSLVHDDLPAMDDDKLRRGKATTHIQYGEAKAILAGDALQTRAFEILSAPTLSIAAPQQLKLIEILSNAAGGRGMCGGQMFDLEAIGQPLNLAELEMMHIMKTGVMIRAAVLMGAECGKALSPSDLAKLDHFAKCMGLAFQIVDDILDAEGKTVQLGKTAGKDKLCHKPTYVSLLGLSEAKNKAKTLYEEARACLSVFDERALRLYELADFIIKRHY